MRFKKLTFLFVIFPLILVNFYYMRGVMAYDWIESGLSCGIGTADCADSGFCDRDADCRTGLCALPSCASRAHATSSASRCTKSGCTCFIECSGGVASCNNDGSCSYTCDSGWYNDDGVNSNGCENAAPSYSTPSVNDTSPSEGDPVSFNVNWTDTTGGTLSWGILSVNASSSCDGTWTNITNTSLSGTSQFANMTWTIPCGCAGKAIAWKQYANDSYNRWNVTSEQTLTVQLGWLNVTLLTPTPNVQTNWTQNHTYWVNATVECEDASCGSVEGLVRYNKSSANPDTGINKTEGAIPFYIANAYLRPVDYAPILPPGSGFEDPTYAYDNDYNDTSTHAEIWTWMNERYTNYTYSLGSTTSARLFVTTNHTNILYYPGHIKIYNFTANDWYDWFTVISTVVTNDTTINTSSGLINSTGHVILGIYTENLGGDISEVALYDTYVEVDNPQHCGNMNEGDTCTLKWRVNATGAVNTYRKIDVNFSSNYDLANDTDDALIRIKWPKLTVSLTTPSPSTCIESSPCEWTQNNTYWVNATVSCSDGSCGNVNATVRYNKSSADLDTPVNTTEGATPFYVVQGWYVYQASSASNLAYKTLTQTPGSTPDSAIDEFSGGEYEFVIISNDSRVSKSLSVIDFCGGTYTGDSCSGLDEFDCSLLEPCCVYTTSCIRMACGGLDLSECTQCSGCSVQHDTKYIHFKFTFDLSDIDVNKIKQIKYYYEGYYDPTYTDSGTRSAYLQYNDSSGWHVDQNLGTSEDTYNKTFTSGFSSLINNGNFTFGATGKVTSASSSLIGLDLYVDYVKLEVITNDSTGYCGNMNQGDTCTLTWEINATGDENTYWKIDVNFSSSFSNISSDETDDAVIKIVLPLNVHVNGIALYYYTGERVDGNVTIIPLEDASSKTTATFTNGEWSSDFHMSTDNVEYLTIIIDDNLKMGYTQLKLDNPSSVTLSCTNQNISLSGYSVDLNSGNTITSGNVKISALETDYTNKTTFTGTWSIDFHPCLIPGKLYTLQILISDDTGKRGEILQKYPAR